jgi:hypothetical protein
MTRRLRSLAGWRRRFRTFALVTLGLLLVAGPAAVAKNRGTDVLGNISPESLLGGGGSLVDRYPLSAYSLDSHVDVGITNPGGISPRRSRSGRRRSCGA